jgi:signal peptidase I
MQDFLKKIFPTNTQKENKSTKSQTREWFDAIIFAVLIASIVRWGIAEAITIPTASMEGTIMAGDFLFISKLHYGARTPQTPLQIPFTHQTIWGTTTNAYVEWLQLPMYRMPAISTVQRNDIVAFNYSGINESMLPIDMRTHFIKRCVALPNDKIEIIQTKLYINDKLVENPSTAQSSYYVHTKDIISEKEFHLLNIHSIHTAPDGYLIHATAKQAKALESLSAVEDIIPIKDEKGRGSVKIFPYSPLYAWNLDNFGAMIIPSAGMKIEMTEKNVALYESLLLKHENNIGATIQNNKFYINGILVKEYVFKHNYYFMLGDNRHDSDDSRVWGLVPESHLIGKAMLIWWSMNPEGGFLDFFSRIRWERIGNTL